MEYFSQGCVHLNALLHCRSITVTSAFNIIINHETQDDTVI